MAFPYIFIFDIDGTLIGDIGPQITMYEIVKMVKARRENIQFDTQDFMHKLKNGIVRPNFNKLVETLKQQFVNVEFFIYTASQKEWAHFLIKIFEKAYNIKFNRPLFTRVDCIKTAHGDIVKQLSNIKPRIFRCLKKKYPHMLMQDLNNRTLMIDNSRIFPENENNQVLICPTYKFKYPENILGRIKHDIFERYHRQIGEVMNLPLTSNFLKFQKFFYRKYVDEIADIQVFDDQFWNKLCDILIKKNIRHLDEKVVRYMNIKSPS